MEPGHKKGRIQSPMVNAVQTIDSHDLARHLHGDNNYFLLDCRPVLAYNSCHISGAVNVNFTGMIKKRFIAGKIGLPDLFSQEAKEKFKVRLNVYACRLEIVFFVKNRLLFKFFVNNIFVV